MSIRKLYWLSCCHLTSVKFDIVWLKLALTCFHFQVHFPLHYVWRHNEVINFSKTKNEFGQNPEENIILIGPGQYTQILTGQYYTIIVFCWGFTFHCIMYDVIMKWLISYWLDFTFTFHFNVIKQLQSFVSVNTSF
jgi:hypothetical protein